MSPRPADTPSHRRAGARGPDAILVRGARVHNLRDVDVDVPLGAFTALTGVSGSGKSSLAMGVLYAEGSRRYLEGLSTYTRRRLRQSHRPEVDAVEFAPAALALGQRPPQPGPRSTVGTMTQALAPIRLLYSRLGTLTCPNGHAVPPSYANALSPERVCPVCGVTFSGPSAEDFSFNGAGACPTCDGLGVSVRIDPATLVPDPGLTIEGGAVAPWRGLMRSQMPRVAAELGVRIDVPWRNLTDGERDLVLHGEAVRRPIMIPTRTGKAVELNAQYVNAHDAVEQIRGEGQGRAARKFLIEDTCPDCGGSRWSDAVRGIPFAGRSIAELTALPADRLDAALAGVAEAVPDDARALAEALIPEVRAALSPMLTLGLGYLALARAGDTLSTGERQRIALSRTVLRHNTGLLLVLDEPTVGLHPDDVAGLIALFDVLVGDGNTLVVVDHDVQVLRAADHLLELGPGAGAQGGRIVAQGTPEAVAADASARIAPYLRAARPQRVRPVAEPTDRAVRLHVERRRNLRDVSVTVPLRRLTVVAGVSGAGKSTLVGECLVPAVEDAVHGRPLPEGVAACDADGVRTVRWVDSSPVGRNARSTLVTYAGAFDAIRQLFADTDAARERGWGVSHFSYNTPDGRCPTCLGTGELELDLQYLPDLPMPCPTCDGRRYRADADEVRWHGLGITDVLALTVDQAVEVFAAQPGPLAVFEALRDVGLGYVTLGEPTPSLSGGEAQRLRLAKRIRRSQRGTLFVFDEPTIGLHPDDVRVLLGVMDRLMELGATVVAVDHDLDLIANADHVIELGPGAGADGGRVIAQGTAAEVERTRSSRLARWLTGA